LEGNHPTSPLIARFGANLCTEADMQNMLDKLHDWCKRWRVLINTDKSKVVHFRAPRKKRSESQFRIGGNILQITDKYKYLAPCLRDRPFNLRGGGYGFLFRSEKKFRTTQELEYLFFCRAKREFFFQNLT
jgi:hypothetical protein